MGVSPSPSPAPLVCLLLLPPGPLTGPNSSLATSAGVAGAGKVVCLLLAQHSDCQMGGTARGCGRSPSHLLGPLLSALEASGPCLSLTRRLGPMGTGHCREAGEKLRRPGLHKPDWGLVGRCPRHEVWDSVDPCYPRAGGPRVTRGQMADQKGNGLDDL